MKINKLIEEAPQRHAERVARWKADPQVNDMMRSTAPDRIWFTKIGKDILPNSERVTAEDVEYVRAVKAEAERDAANALNERLAERLWFYSPAGYREVFGHSHSSASNDSTLGSQAMTDMIRRDDALAACAPLYGWSIAAAEELEASIEAVPAVTVGVPDDVQRYRPDPRGFMVPDPQGVWVDHRILAAPDPAAIREAAIREVLALPRVSTDAPEGWPYLIDEDDVKALIAKGAAE